MSRWRAILEEADAALQLAALLAEDARRGGAPADWLADLERVRDAARRLKTAAVELPAQAADPADLPSTIRHDRLGTPLGHLLGYADLMHEDAAEPWRGRFAADLDQLRAAGRRIQQVLSGRPVDVSPPLPLPVARFPTERTAAEPGRLLVVDDNESNRHMLMRWLSRQGHAVSLAASGTEALALLETAAFDVVLLDVQMPGPNGFEVLARMKASARLRDVPVIMVSALNELDHVAACIEAGAEDYLTKPFQPVLLKARIDACLEKKRLLDRERDHLRQIDRERSRNSELLHMILPAEIVEELLTTGGVQPRRYEGVAVLFADIAGFTGFCERVSPETVVGHLVELVRAFEEAALRHGVQKIKTIGDSFMAAAGLLRPVPDPVMACLRCGTEMIAAAKRLPPHWDLRVGVHYGSVVAGLLGSRQYLFDLWGDTVNLAARVEQHGIAGAVTLSRVAWDTVAAVCRGQSLGAVELKGKGRMELVRLLRECDAD